MAPRTASRRSQITRPSASCWSTTTKPAVTQLSEWIKRQEWEPIAVKDGNAAIEHIYDGVAVIVTDLKMPRTDGMELLRLAKKQAPSWPRLCGGSRDTHHGFGFCERYALVKLSIMSSTSFEHSCLSPRV